MCRSEVVEGGESRVEGGESRVKSQNRFSTFDTWFVGLAASFFLNDLFEQPFQSFLSAQNADLDGDGPER